MEEVLKHILELQQQQQLQQQQLQQQQQQQRRQQQEQNQVLLEAIRALLTARPEQQPRSHSAPSFPKFEPDRDAWASYHARLNQHFLYHGVTEDVNKRAFFLSISGSELYELLQKLFPLKRVEEVEFPQLIEKLFSHFERKPHVVAARYSFFKSRIKPGDSHKEWVTELTGLTRDCAFKCVCGLSYAESLIRDMIVQHTPEDKVRMEALQLEDPSLAEVQKIATTFEITSRAAKQITDPMEVMLFSRNTDGNRESQQKAKSPRKPDLKSCRFCGVSHSREKCKFRNAKCYFCGVTGHIQSVCRKKSRGAPGTKEDKERMEVNIVNEVISSGNENKVFVDLEVAGENIKFQVDTGSPVTLINLRTYRRLGAPQCSRANLNLCSFGKDKIDVKGIFRAVIGYKGVHREGTITVVNREDTTNVMGMDVFCAFNFKIEDRVNLVSETVPFGEIEILGKDFENLFQDGLGKASDWEAHIQLKDGAVPRYCKARPVPLALREQVKSELVRLQKLGIITPVKTSVWATPLVVVKKADGTIRLCGDFKSTVNAQLEIEKYPIPRPEELFQKLAGGKYFSKIDLRDAYLQLPLDEESKQCLTVNTPLGLFQYERLPFGVASAAPIFQRYLEQLIAGVPGSMNYLDDIVVTGRTNKEHIQNLRNVLGRLQAAGLKAKLKKCEFFKPCITYLGHMIDKEGIRPTQANVEAIVNLPTPRDIKQLQSFLGKANYYAKFIQDFSEVAAPLNALRRKGASFLWSPACNTAFEKIRKALVEAVKLRHFDPDRTLILATDASDYGIGAVLSQKDELGQEHPIAFASKTLNIHQRRYAQIEKEALSIIFGVRKFNEYLYGNKFLIVTDHKPLVELFHPARRIPDNTLRKMQRWALFLSDYNYRIMFRSTAQHGNADALSRLPVGPDNKFDEQELECLQLDQLQEEAVLQFPLDQRVIAAQTDRDTQLASIRAFIRSGKRSPADNLESNPLWKFRERLKVRAGVLLLEAGDQVRVVIPASLRQRVLSILHKGHWGIVLTKQLARKYCYWPSIDKDIETRVRSCEPCQAFQKSPGSSFKEWPEPQEVWQRVHIDFAGPFQGSMWLILVDASSGFPYVIRMTSTTADCTVRALQSVFSIEGLPATIVSDNGPQFTGESFQKFCQANGIEHILAPPFHPRSNGEAERFVQTFKSAMNKAKFEGRDQQEAVLELLSSYRALPGREGTSPAQRLHGRQPRTLLSLFLPREKTYRTEQPRFEEGARVMLKTHKDSPRWIPGTIVKVEGARCYTVRTRDRQVRRHQEQLRPRHFPVKDLDGSEDLGTEAVSPSNTTDTPFLQGSRRFSGHQQEHRHQPGHHGWFERKQPQQESPPTGLTGQCPDGAQPEQTSQDTPPEQPQHDAQFERAPQDTQLEQPQYDAQFEQAHPDLPEEQEPAECPQPMDYEADRRGAPGNSQQELSAPEEETGDSRSVAPQREPRERGRRGRRPRSLSRYSPYRSASVQRPRQELENGDHQQQEPHPEERMEPPKLDEPKRCSKRLRKRYQPYQAK